MTRTRKAQLLVAFLTLLFLVAKGFSQETATGRLLVVVEPEAKMTVETVQLPRYDTTHARWLQVNLIVRMNPETTVSLYGEPVSLPSRMKFLVRDSGQGSPHQAIKQGAPLFTTNKNGQHAFLVGIVTEEPEQSTRFILRSSDGAIHISAAVSGVASVPSGFRWGSGKNLLFQIATLSAHNPEQER